MQVTDASALQKVLQDMAVTAEKQRYAELAALLMS